MLAADAGWEVGADGAGMVDGGGGLKYGCFLQWGFALQRCACGSRYHGWFNLHAAEPLSGLSGVKLVLGIVSFMPMPRTFRELNFW